MFPISPIISSIITFLEAQSLCRSEGVVSMLRTVSDFMRLPLSPYMRLSIVAFCVPSLAMLLLLFPFADGMLPIDLLLAVAAGVATSNTYAAVPAGVAFLVRVAYRLYARRREKEEKEEGWRLVGDVRDFYMTGISEEGGISCEVVEERVDAFMAFGRPSKLSKAATAIAGGLLGVGASVAYLLGRGMLFVVITAVAAAYLLLCCFLSLSDCLLSALSSITLRLSVVLLEVLYMPTAEEATTLLHPVAYCPQRTTSQAEGRLVGDFSNYTCNATGGWRLSPYGYPAIDYVRSLLECLPLFAFLLLATVVGLPLLEVVVCLKSRRVVDYSYTIGERMDGRWEETVASLKTPAIYTFFLYKRSCVLYAPLSLFLKAVVAFLSHVQLSSSFPFLLPIFHILHFLLSLFLSPFSFVCVHILDMAMHAINVTTSLLVAVGLEGKHVTVLRSVASAAPIAGWVVVFLLLLRRRKKRQKEEEMVVDDVVEDAEVVRERMEKLYAVVAKILEKEILCDVVDYAWLFLVAGGLAFGFYARGFIF